MSTEQEKPAGAQGETPKRKCRFGSLEGHAVCMEHETTLTHTETGWLCRPGGVTIPFGSSFDTIHPNAQAEEIDRLRAERDEAFADRDFALLMKTPQEQESDWKSSAEAAESQVQALRTKLDEVHKAWDDENERRHDATEQVQALQAQLSEAQQRIETLTKLAREVLVWLPDNLPSSELYAAVDNLAAVIPTAPQEDQP